MIRAYRDPFLDRVAHFIQTSLTASSIIVNFLLFCLVATNSRREIGPYRYLLLCFAACDVYYAVVHFLHYPIPEMHGNAFLIRGHGLFTSPVWAALFSAVYSQSFPLLVCHFLYRLAAIKRPSALRPLWKWIVSLWGAVTLHSLWWFWISYMLHGDKEGEEVLREFLEGNISSPILHLPQTAHTYNYALYWSRGTFDGFRLRDFLATCMVALSMTAAYTFIIACSIDIMHHLRSFPMSAATARLQAKLFKCLVYQTVLPFITSYTPAGVSMFCPIFGIELPSIALIFPPFCAAHPLFDGLLIMFTISEYKHLRSLLSSLFGCSLIPSVSVVDSHPNPSGRKRSFVFVRPRPRSSDL